MSGEQETHAIAELKARHAEETVIKKENDDKNFNDAWTIAIDGKKGRKGVPESLWLSLDPADRDKINNEIEHQADRAYTLNERARVARDRQAQEKARKTNQGTWYDLWSQSNNDPQAFVNRDLRKDKEMLSDSDFQELSKRQTTVKDSLGKPDKLQRVSTLGEQVERAVTFAGVGLGKSEDDKIKKASAIRAVEKALVSSATAKGKNVTELTDEEVEKVTDKLLINGEVDGSGFFSDTNKFAFELTPEEKGSFIPDDPSKYYKDLTYADVPASEVSAIKAELRKRNRVATPQEILRVYKASKGVK
jgi:hypothetical protein